MLRWVLLCDYCSFYHHLPKTSEFGRATTAHIIVVVYFRDHYHWIRVCSFAELSSAFIISAPEGAAVVYINNSHISSSGLHYTSMGHARLVCTHLYIISHLVEGRIYRFLSSPTDFSIRPHSCSLLQHCSQSKKH
jgi:hypothetical protein